MRESELGQMVYAYLDCAVWAGLDWSRCSDWDEDGHGDCTEECVGNGNPARLDENYDYDDVAEETVAALTEECRDFYSANVDDLEEMRADQVGHDFYLTRNGHGSGFWDRGLGEVGDRLADAAKVYGEWDLYVGDDGRLYA